MASYSGNDPMWALAEKAAGGGKTRFSRRSESMLGLDVAGAATFDTKRILPIAAALPLEVTQGAVTRQEKGTPWRCPRQ
jgi:hypothetical protein